MLLPWKHRGPMLALAAALAACAPLHAPRVAGRVADAATGAPVAGGEIFTSYDVGTGDEGDRWATTDAEGRFDFEPYVLARWYPQYLVAVRPRPFVLFVDRRYGAFSLRLPADEARWSQLEFHLSPEPASLESMKSPAGWRALCPGLRRAVCQRVCEVAYQDRALCETLVRSE